MPPAKRGEPESEYWRLKFEQLRDLRVTEAEQELQLEKSRAQDAEAELTQTVVRLEAQLEAVSGAGAASSDAEAEAGAVDALKAKLERQASVIEAYQQLTSICIRADERGHSCTAINHLQRRALRFHLEDSAPTSGHEATLKFKPTGNIQWLPECLRESTRIEAKQAPLVLQRILRSLYRDGEEAA